MKKIKKKKKKNKPNKKIPQVNIISYVADLFGCYLYRLQAPSIVLNEYQGTDIRFNWFSLNRFIRDPNFYNSTTVVIFQRPSTEEHLKMMLALREAAFKHQFLLVYEVDDLLFDIPKYNYFANEYYEKQKEFCIKNIQAALHCTTSTNFLKKQLQKYNPNVTVFPNYLPKYLWHSINKFKDNKHKKLKILWAGSSTHFSDKINIKNDLDIVCDAFFKTYNKYEWVFFGSVPPRIQQSGKPFSFFSWKTNSEYPRFIKNLDIDIAIGSLVENDFNKAKSNIKRLEYTACGFAGIYASFPGSPYEDATCTYKYNNVDELLEKIQMLEDPKEREVVVSSEQEKLKNRLFLEDNVHKIIKKWKKILRI